MNTIGKTYQKMRKGYPLTTPELQAFVKHMEGLEEYLRPLGPESNIVRSHVLHEKAAPESFLSFRGIRN